MKALLKKLLMFILKDEVEAIQESIQIDLQTRIDIARSEIAHDLLHDIAFIYGVSEMILLDGDLTASVEDSINASINRLEMRVSEIEERENN